MQLLMHHSVVKAVPAPDGSIVSEHPTPPGIQQCPSPATRATHAARELQVLCLALLLTPTLLCRGLTQHKANTDTSCRG